MIGPETYYACYFPESPSYQFEVAEVVNCFRENGYKVEMDVMNSNELVDLGPTRWAEQQIKNARNVLVFLSPELLRLCASGLEGAESSQQVQWKDNPMLDTYKVTSRLRGLLSCY